MSEFKAGAGQWVCAPGQVVWGRTSGGGPLLGSRLAQAHHSFGNCPENHLWDAAHGYPNLLTADRPFPDGAG